MREWLRVGIIVLAGFIACSKDGEKSGFLEECTSSDQCPSDWVCPDIHGEGTGTVGDVCTPNCEDDSDCTTILGRTDVFCYSPFCAIECAAHSDCPEVLPFCRGSEPSCSALGLTPWCAKENFYCD